MKTLNCDLCQLNAHSPYLLCAVHPGGVTAETCPDFQATEEEEELWTPEGYTGLPAIAPQSRGKSSKGESSGHR